MEGRDTVVVLNTHGEHVAVATEADIVSLIRRVTALETELKELRNNSCGPERKVERAVTRTRQETTRSDVRISAND